MVIVSKFIGILIAAVYAENFLSHGADLLLKLSESINGQMTFKPSRLSRSILQATRHNWEILK